MKRMIYIFAVLLALVSVACAQQKNEPAAADNPAADSKAAAENKSDSPDSVKKKVLVAYFSATGVTENAARQLAEAAGGTLHKIQPEKPYSAADLDWHDKQSRSSVEMADKKSRPAIAGKPEGLAEYDIVYVGFPIWWYTAPTIINTFMESNDFKGKTVIPFATSGGSTIDQACEDLKKAYPEVNWKEGKLLNNTDKEELQNWTASHQK